MTLAPASIVPLQFVHNSMQSSMQNGPDRQCSHEHHGQAEVCPLKLATIKGGILLMRYRYLTVSLHPLELTSLLDIHLAIV